MRGYSEVRLPPAESVEIGAADADALDLQHHLALGEFGLGNFESFKSAGFLTGDGFHAVVVA